MRVKTEALRQEAWKQFRYFVKMGNTRLFHKYRAFEQTYSLEELINETNYQPFETLLHTAINANSAKMVKELIQVPGIDPTVVDCYGIPPIIDIDRPNVLDVMVLYWLLQHDGVRHVSHPFRGSLMENLCSAESNSKKPIPVRMEFLKCFLCEYREKKPDSVTSESLEWMIPEARALVQEYMANPEAFVEKYRIDVMEK